MAKKIQQPSARPNAQRQQTQRAKEHSPHQAQRGYGRQPFRYSNVERRPFRRRPQRGYADSRKYDAPEQDGQQVQERVQERVPVPPTATAPANAQRHDGRAHGHRHTTVTTTHPLTQGLHRKALFGSTSEQHEATTPSSALVPVLPQAIPQSSAFAAKLRHDALAAFLSNESLGLAKSGTAHKTPSPDASAALQTASQHANRHANRNANRDGARQSREQQRSSDISPSSHQSPTIREDASTFADDSSVEQSEPSTEVSQNNKPDRSERRQGRGRTWQESGEPIKHGQQSRRVREQDVEDRLLDELLTPEQLRRERRERVPFELKPVELSSIFRLSTYLVSSQHQLRQPNDRKQQQSSRNKRHQPSKKGVQASPLVHAIPSQAVQERFSLTHQQLKTPALAAVHHAAEKALQDFDVLAEGSTIVCAVSGGADSVAMLDVLHALALQHQMRLAVAHCNHLLRGAAAEDAEFVRRLAAERQLDCYVAEVNVRQFAAQNKLSTETAARLLRYQFLEYVAYSTRALAVATAHTMDDSVETFLMNLLRGSGLTGLSGISPSRPFGQLSALIRPVLAVNKTDLLAYCQERTLAWREDETNHLLLHRRNNIRHDLLPKLEKDYSPSMKNIIHRTAQIIREADGVIAEIVERSLEPIIEIPEAPVNYLLLRVTALTNHSRFLQGEIVHRAAQKKFGEQFGNVAFSSDALERVLKLVSAETGAKTDISKHFFALRDRETLVIAPKLPIYNIDVRVEKNNEYDFGGWRLILREVERKNVKFTADPSVDFFDSALLPYRMTLRTWQAGDAFQPLGMKGTVKVSDFLTNSKLSLMNRQNALVLATTHDIVWLCGMRMSEKFRISNDTKTALRVEYRPKKLSQPLPTQQANEKEQ